MTFYRFTEGGKINTKNIFATSFSAQILLQSVLDTVLLPTNALQTISPAINCTEAPWVPGLGNTKDQMRQTKSQTVSSSAATPVIHAQKTLRI